MKLGIMQPYLFPYIGYFSLIKHTDEFILFDPVQFIRHGWIERNRVLKQNDGWLYVKVPLVKAHQNALIKDMLIDNSQDWKAKIFAQLQPYKKTAPHYDAVLKMLRTALAPEYTSIVSLNAATLQAVCDYLGIDRKLKVFSEMNLTIEQPTAPDEWALNICKAIRGVDEYWNPPGGKEFFDVSKYDAADIDLKFQSVTLSPYDQKRQPFETGLSILDVMMFNSPQQIQGMLNDYQLS